MLKSPHENSLIPLIIYLFFSFPFILFLKISLFLKLKQKRKEKQNGDHGGPLRSHSLFFIFFNYLKKIEGKEKREREMKNKIYMERVKTVN